MLARNDPWSDLANAVASGKILPWSKSMLNKLETACIQGQYSGEEWREVLHSKLIQLASSFGFKHYFADGVLQGFSNFIRIDFNLHTLKCFVAYAGEDFSECLKTGQYLLNQKWNEIQKSLTIILTLFSPSQSQDKLQTKYNQLKECERRMMMLFNGSKRKGIYFMEVPIFEDFTAIITPTPQNNNNCLMIHLSEPLYINLLSLELISCSLVDPTFQNSVQLNKTELTKLQLITKQKSNIQCAHAIQFDQGLIPTILLSCFSFCGVSVTSTETGGFENWHSNHIVVSVFSVAFDKNAGQINRHLKYHSYFASLDPTKAKS